MDRQQIGLKLAFDTLEIPLRLGTFEERMVVQKATYLAQAAGVHLDYRFRWYLRGPYSSDLTRDAFAIAAELATTADATNGWQLDDSSTKRLARLRGVFAGISAADLPRRLELLASVHFLIARPGQSHEPAPLRKVLLRYEKDFSELEIEQAVEELNENGLIAAA